MINLLESNVNAQLNLIIPNTSYKRNMWTPKTKTNFGSYLIQFKRRPSIEGRILRLGCGDSFHTSKKSPKRVAGICLPGSLTFTSSVTVGVIWLSEGAEKRELSATAKRHSKLVANNFKSEIMGISGRSNKSKESRHLRLRVGNLPKCASGS